MASMRCVRAQSKGSGELRPGLGLVLPSALLVPFALLSLLTSACAGVSKNAPAGPHLEPDLVVEGEAVPPSKAPASSAKAAPGVGSAPLAPSATAAAEKRRDRRFIDVELKAIGRADGELSWPVKGVLYARFGKKGRQPHDGIDLAAPSGTPVRAAAPGSVLYAGEQKGYGLIAILEHGEGLVTIYAHNRDLRVKTGQKVRAGQVVATVGESGRTSGPHLHFEVRQSGVPVDPLEHLGPLPAD